MDRRFPQRNVQADLVTMATKKGDVDMAGSSTQSPVMFYQLLVKMNPKAEGNKVVATSLLKILPYYPKVDLLIMDRCCHFMPSALKTEGLQQLKYFSHDRFHSYGHSRACPCNPLFKTRLKKRISGLNTSVGEQTFSRFRGYAKILNDMRPLRHRFAVPLFVKWHNDVVSAGNIQHLNQYKVRKTGKNSKAYACNNAKKDFKKNMKSKKAMKVMKSSKTVKSKRAMK